MHAACPGLCSSQRASLPPPPAPTPQVPAAASLADLLRRPHVHYALLQRHGLGAPTLDLAAAAGAADAHAAASSSSASASGTNGSSNGAQPAAAAVAPSAGSGGGEQPPAEHAQLQQGGQQQGQPLTAPEQEATEIDIKYEGFIRRQVSVRWACSAGCAR